MTRQQYTDQAQPENNAVEDQEAYTDPNTADTRTRQTVPPDNATDASGQPRAQPEGAEADSAPVTAQLGQNVTLEDDEPAPLGPGAQAEADAEELTDEELQAEMERRHRIAARLRKAARQAPQDDPETAEVRAEAGRMASAPNIPKPYSTGKWGDMPNYQCNVREVGGGLCPHATLSEEGAWLHYVGSHLRNQRPSDDELLDDDEYEDEEG